MCLNSCFTSRKFTYLQSEIFARIIDYYDVCRIAYIFTTNHLKRYFTYMNNWYSSRGTVVIKVLRERELFMWWKIKFLSFFIKTFPKLNSINFKPDWPRVKVELKIEGIPWQNFKRQFDWFFFNMLRLTYEWKILKLK